MVEAGLRAPYAFHHRFLIFAHPHAAQRGGFADFLCVADTVEDAREACRGHDVAQIVDLLLDEIETIVDEGEADVGAIWFRYPHEIPRKTSD